MVPVCLVMFAVCYHVVLGTEEQRLTSTPTQSLQSVLYSIEERLRALDLVYVARSYAPRHQVWDTEQYTRRLDTIEARIGRIEALLEMRLDKIQEMISENKVKQRLASEQAERKIESLYDRLNHRMSYTENRLDLDVAKIQSSIDAGFTRLARTEPEVLESDIETQLQDLQRQFDAFDAGQNATHAKLSELGGRKCFVRTELNDAEEVDRDESDRFARSIDDVATKVHKMVAEFSQRSQSMESLVKNSMSLANATRRELQDGLKTLGLRLVFHGKHNKESTFEYGWDALATLITKEFARVSSNHDKLAASQQDFRQSCHRLQDKEQQLSETVAKVLDGILDVIRNRSLDMEKQMSTIQEILKNHNSQILRTVSLPEKSGDLGQILAAVQTLQEQLDTLKAANDTKAPCPDSNEIAATLLASINKNDFTPRLADPTRTTTAVGEVTAGKTCDDTNNCHDLTSRSGRNKHKSVGKDEIRVNILDILAEQHGETLQYNVTEDHNESDAAKQQQMAESIADNNTEGSNDYEFDKADKSDQAYDDEVEEDIVLEKPSGDVIDLNGDILSNVAELNTSSPSNNPNTLPQIVGSNGTANGSDGAHSVVAEDSLQRGNGSHVELIEEKAAAVQSEVTGMQFSKYWHRIRNNTDAVALDVNVQSPEKVQTDTSNEDDLRTSSNHDLKMLDRAQLRHDNTDYNDSDE